MTSFRYFLKYTAKKMLKSMKSSCRNGIGIRLNHPQIVFYYHIAFRAFDSLGKPYIGAFTFVWSKLKLSTLIIFALLFLFLYSIIFLFVNNKFTKVLRNKIFVFILLYNLQKTIAKRKKNYLILLNYKIEYYNIIYKIKSRLQL